jgi:DNA-binding MarR family transcriptional regulator
VTDRSLDTKYQDAEESPGLLMWQVTNRWQAAQRATLKPYGLTHVQFVLLAALAYLGADGAVRQRDLAETAATDPMMTSQVLRTLEARGLVVRGVHPHDRRARALEVTPEGRALVNRAVVAVEECDTAFFSALQEGLAAFTHALQTLKAGAPHSGTGEGELGDGGSGSGSRESGSGELGYGE